jgi:FMN reductase (NADPH)
MANPVLESLLAHRTIRKFTSRRIEPEILDQILHAGIRSATASNLQRYSIIVIDDQTIKQELGIGHAPIGIALLADQYRIHRWLKLNSPLEIHTDSTDSLFMGMWDAHIVLQSIVMAAEGLGLGTCYIGGFVGADITHLFNAPPLTMPAGLICLGYPDESPQLSVRLPLTAIVHRNFYHQLTDEELRQAYQQREAIWETTAPETKQHLLEQGIASIPQAIAAQRFSLKVTNQRSQQILSNIRQAGFKLDEAE